MAGLAVLGCEGPSTMVKSPTYTVFHDTSYVATYACHGDQPKSHKWWWMGSRYPPNHDYVINEQPINRNIFSVSPIDIYIYRFQVSTTDLPARSTSVNLHFHHFCGQLLTTIRIMTHFYSICLLSHIFWDGASLTWGFWLFRWSVSRLL